MNVWKELSKVRKIMLITVSALIVLVILYILILVSENGQGQSDTGSVDVTVPSSMTSTSSPVSSARVTTSEASMSDGHLNPFTGEEFTTSGTKRNRPLLVSYDNHNDAWPQSGISSADFYIEVLAEGMITRFLGLFYSEPPDLVGPIRSARPYIVSKAIELDAFLAHVGGSQQALTDIVVKNVADLDGLWSGAFYRTSPKIPPHNTYAAYEDLMREAERQGYRMEGDPFFYDFGVLERKYVFGDAKKLCFPYRSSGAYGDGGYVVSYLYDAKAGEYARFVNDAPCLDELDESQIVVANVLVQFADHKVLDAEGRLAIDLESAGGGYLIRDGKIAKIKWEKREEAALTEFFYEDGSRIKLEKGKTILHIVYPEIFDYDAESTARE